MLLNIYLMKTMGKSLKTTSVGNEESFRSFARQTFEVKIEENLNILYKKRLIENIYSELSMLNFIELQYSEASGIASPVAAQPSCPWARLEIKSRGRGRYHYMCCKYFQLMKRFREERFT